MGLSLKKQAARCLCMLTTRLQGKLNAPVRFQPRTHCGHGDLQAREAIRV